MTHATAINASHKVNLDVTLLFGNIPYLWGTRAGLVHPGTNLTNAPTLTSVAGLVPDTISVGSSSLNLDTLIVSPSDAGVSIRIDKLTWDQYFERRRTPQYTLITRVDNDDTTWTLNTTSGISSGDVLYINRETVKVDGAPAGNQIVVIRNHCGLPGNAGAVHQAGATISKTPRHILGRVAELRVWPSPDAADSRVIKYLRAAGSPVYDRDAGGWVLSFDDNMRLFDRRIATGFRGARVGATLGSFDGAGDGVRPVLALTPAENAREFAETQGTGLDGHLLITGDGEGCVVPIDSYASSLPRVSINGTGIQNTLYSLDDGAVPALFNGEAIPDAELSMRRCYLFTGPPMVAALQLILSDAGDQNNHATYDVLFGISSTGTSTATRVEAGETECRFGAAIPSGLVDVPTGDILTQTCPGFFLLVGANGEENLLDALEEIAWALKGYWYLNSDQKLAFRTFEAAYAIDTYAASLTDDDILLGTKLTSVDDESEIVHTISINCNHHPVDNKFLGKLNCFYGELRETYRDTAGTLEMSRKSLAVELTSGETRKILRDISITPADLESVRLDLDRVFARRAFDTRKYQVMLPWKYATLECGDRVRVTFDQFNSFDNATANALSCEVTGIVRDLSSGIVTVELTEVFSESCLLAPTGAITGWSAGSIRLGTNTKWGGGTNPARQFAIGWKVRVLDASATVQFGTASNVLTVTAVSNTVVDVTGTVGFTPASGDILTLAAYDDSDSAVANASHGLYQRQHAFLADSNQFLGTANDAGKFWS